MILKNFTLIKLLLWLLLLALIPVKSLQAQSYIADIRKISVEDGLSSRFVNAIYKDSQGFMWIATHRGLHRYDGYTFKIYTKENSALTSNIINIREDKKQRLWLVGNKTVPLGNIDILDLHTQQIRSFDSVFKGSAPFPARDIRTNVYFDAQKNVWISTVGGHIYRYNNERFDLIFSAPEQGTIQIIHADDTFLWLQGKELLRLTIKTKVVKKFPIQKDLMVPGIDSNNNLWLFKPEYKELVVSKHGEDTLRHVDLTSLNLPEAMYDPGSLSRDENLRINPNDDLLWWYQQKDTSDYFFVFHPRQGIVLDLKPEIAALHTYGYLEINNMYFGFDNRIWISTNDGIFIISLKKNKFTTFIPDESGNYSARGIVEDKQGIIYVNTYNGRMLLDPEKASLRKDKDNSVWLGAFGDEEGNLWFSSQNEVIEKYEPLSGRRQYYMKNTRPNIPWSQWSIIRDKKGRVWVGAQKGLYYLEPETGLYQKFNQHNDFQELGETTIYYMEEDEKGIWIASFTGLYLLEPGKGITTRYAMDEPPPYRIPYNHLVHFHRDDKGILWLATTGGGLIRFDPKDGSSMQFTNTEGLSSNTIYAVYEDDHKNLWMPSNYGLMQFDKTSHRVNTYLTGDGIAHNEFNTTSHYRDTKGRLYFGGLTGITTFHPEDFAVKDSASAPLQLTQCRVLNGKTGALTDKTTTVISSEELVLEPSDKSFIIAFALLNYDNSSQNSYAYKIEGLDKDWTNIAGNDLRINALPYGSYVLHIKGRSIKGAWSANELAIEIVVKSPFFLQTWFISMCVLALGFIIYGIFRRRLQNLKQAKIKLQQTVKERTQEIRKQKDEIEQQAKKLKDLNATQSRWFTNIAHELRTPLTLILGPIKQFLNTHSQSSQTNIQNIELAQKNSLNLLKLVNEILDVSRLEANELKLSIASTNLSRLIRESTAHFDSFAAHKGVALTIHIPFNINLNIDKDRIQKIIINLISNALKFTHSGGSVSVALTYKKEEGISISVTDTGDGIAEKDLPHIFKRYYQASDSGQINQGGTGIGLALSLELAKLHGGDLSAESKIGKGSIFTLSLPHKLITKVEKAGPGKTLVSHPMLSDNSNPKETKEDQHKPLVLLVEDNPDMRQYIREFMAKQYRIREAADGMEAIGILKKLTPGLIISDIMMPRMDGISLAKTLKNDERFKNIPFITLTARADEQGKIEALRTGIDDYLTKPFNPEELAARASNLIRNYKERKTAIQADPGQISAPAHQDKMVEDMKANVIQHLEDSSFSVSTLAAHQNMSLSSLKRFLRKATGLSPGQFIREIRLQQARRLLEAKQYPTVLEVVYAVGFENASHFAKLFSERFGKKPSEYL